MEKPSPIRVVILWCCRLLLGGSFIFAAVLKIKDPSMFVSDIDHYKLLPYPLAVLLGIYLPWLELLCGTAVLVRRLERGALVLLLGLCVVFSVALATAWFRGLDINCGCFGHGTTTNLPLALIRDLVLGGLAVALWATLDRKPEGGPI